MPGRSGFSDANRGELLRLQATDKPLYGRKGSGLEFGELDLQVADKPLYGRKGSGLEFGELDLQATDKPLYGRKGSGLEFGELDLQVADKPLNLAHAHPTMFCIHLVVKRIRTKYAHTGRKRAPNSEVCPMTRCALDPDSMHTSCNLIRDIGISVYWPTHSFSQ